MSLYPFCAATMASPIPVFPEVGSTSVDLPGLMSPRASASWIILRAMRSLTELAGFDDSSLATISAPQSAVTLFSLTRGVWPMSSRMLFAILGRSEVDYIQHVPNYKLIRASDFLKVRYNSQAKEVPSLAFRVLFHTGSKRALFLPEFRRHTSAHQFSRRLPQYYTCCQIAIRPINHEGTRIFFANPAHVGYYIDTILKQTWFNSTSTQFFPSNTVRSPYNTLSSIPAKLLSLHLSMSISPPHLQQQLYHHSPHSSQ